MGIRSVFVAVVAVSGVISALACYQTEIPSAMLSASNIAGRVTWNGKPIKQKVRLELHEAQIPPATPQSGFAITGDVVGERVLQAVSADSEGYFAFAPTPPGWYVIVMLEPSDEQTIVILKKPKGKEHDRVAIEFFADFCQRVGVLGQRSRSTPPIWGMSSQK